MIRFGLALLFAAALSLIVPPAPQAQMLQAIVNATGTGAPTCAALSLSQTPSSGWSTGRKLKGAYAGFAFRLIQSDNTTTQDIGYTAGGCVDTASISLTGTLHYKIIYDNYGTVDFTFASYATAPLYTASCINSRPCMDNTGAPGTGTGAGTNSLAFTGDFAYAAVVLDNSGSPEGGYFGNVLTSGAFPGLYIGPSTQISQFMLSFYHNGTWGNCGGSLTVVDNVIHLAAIQAVSGTGTCRVDGTTASAGAVTSSVTGTTPTMFGGIGGGTYTGKFSEGVAWNGANDVAGYRTSTIGFWLTQ